MASGVSEQSASAAVLRIANADFPGEKNIFQFLFESLIS